MSVVALPPISAINACTPAIDSAVDLPVFLTLYVLDSETVIVISSRLHNSALRTPARFATNPATVIPLLSEIAAMTSSAPAIDGTTSSRINEATSMCRTPAEMS